ncbi:MAG: RNA methyltransferase [Acaryochloridaceae cyanobacterium CSU_3_4]|nr:RNA methyltransferase [Acaryochloridaceae cyanobacterium CSU_3_4]
MIELQLARIRIVLVEPAGSLNVGAVARVMKNMGLTQLVLVNPQCDPGSAEAQRMAVHASDRLTQARCVDTLTEALVGCQRAIATTARPRHLPLNPQPPHQILPWLLEGSSALIFGPEDRGLSNEELYHAQQFLQIPTSTEYAALNLAQAVTICCYELRQLALKKAANPPDSSTLVGVSEDRSQEIDLAPIQDLEDFYKSCEDSLLDIGFLYPHTAAARMGKLRQIFNRSGLSAQEVAMLRGIIRQVQWKIRSN